MSRSGVGGAVRALTLALRAFKSRYALEVIADLSGTRQVSCNICGFTGRFTAFGRPPRYDCRCPSCSSIDRHRLIHRWFSDNPSVLDGSKRILHFAPEAWLQQRLQPRAKTYRSADIEVGRADLVLNAEAIELPDAAADLILFSHILEHVDDRKALRELFRICAPDGMVLIMSPVVESWPRTYENPAVSSPAERRVHFGQADHKRYFGRDIRDRIATAGFVLEEFPATPELVVAHGMRRGDTLFIARKPA